MLQDLLDEIAREVALSKNELNNLNKNLSEVSQNIKVSAKTEIKDDPQYDHKVIGKNQPKFGFSKADRFKTTKVDNYTGAAAPTGLVTACAEIKSQLPHQKNQQNTVFSQSKRFQDDRKDDFRGLFYDVKFDSVKSKTSSAIINPPPMKAKHHQTSMQNNSVYSQGSNFSDLETQASLSQFIGPGAYSINYSCVEPKRCVALPKSKRFTETKKNMIVNYNPNYDLIKKKAPGAVIKNTTVRNDKLKAKDMQKEFQKLEAAMFYRMSAVDKDKCIRPKAGAAVIKESVMSVTAAPKGSRQKIAAIFKFLDQLREMKEGGPGAYQIQEPKPAPTMVVYRKSSYSPIRKDPKEDIPGPDYYYCKDDLIKDNKPQWTFAKDPKEKPMTVEDYDKRDYQVNENQVRKNPTSAIILKEHKPQYLGEEGMLELERGPGQYNPQFKQVEKRTDIGAVKMHDLNEYNARENNMDYLEQNEKFENDIIFPSVDPIKANNKRGFKYYEPTNHQPDHVPDKELFKEEWQFYDYDVNKIKEDMTKGGDFSSKMPKDIFAEHEEFMRIMKNYYSEQNKVPHLGEYKVNFKQIDKHVPGVDLDKIQEKDIYPIVKPEGDVDGDNLIIDNPQRLPKKVADIKFDKMVGRPEKNLDNMDYEEEIRYDINIDPLKPKVPVLVDMKRQKEREELFGSKVEEEKVDLEINYAQQDKKIKGYVEISKIQLREEDPNYNVKPRENEVVLDIQTTQIKPEKKTSVSMGKGAKRFTAINHIKK